MSSFDVFVRALHVVMAAIWLGAAFFAGWFLMPSVAEAGPAGGTVMAGVQKRGWIAIAPVVAILTILSGGWLYRPFAGNFGVANSATILGIGGMLGVIALLIGGGIVSRALAKAGELGAKLTRIPRGPAAQATNATARR